MFLASVYPSRTGVPAYIAYQQEVEALVERINERWATPGWTPIVYDTSDDYPRSVAVLRRADVLLVNPIRDGLNLVAKEGGIVNERDAVLCLSPRGRGVGRAGRGRPRGAALRRGRAPPTCSTGRCGCRRRNGRHERPACASWSSARVPADWLADQLAAAG